MSKQYPVRKSIRLKDYDYSQPGYYFITIRIKERAEDLCKIYKGSVKLSETGKIVDMVWNELASHYSNCKLDEYIIMPDHFHGIIQIIEQCREGSVTLPDKDKNKQKPNNKNHGLPEIIRGFKTFSSKKINEKIKLVHKFRWQKSYHDRIVRDKRELENVRKYIINNPVNRENRK